MLGAGFQLASHDLDIRGAGNLLGDEQSGHIREVGIELYQHMLEEAVAAARTAGGDEARRVRGGWTPQITIGTPVLIPEGYVADLGVRLGLYRRLAQLASRRELDGFAAELIDRFGPLPHEVENLLEIIAIKRACREAGIEKLEAGPKGAVITLRGNRFANPAGLVDLIQQQRRHLEAPSRPEDRLSAQLGGREGAPRRRRQAAAGACQDRPCRKTQRRRSVAAEDPRGDQTAGSQKSLKGQRGIKLW